MPFFTGQRVVCINDSFAMWVYELYDNLPRKNVTYVIRSTSMGRCDIRDQGLDSMVESVTLMELKNGLDPHYKGGEQELQFNANRFRPLTEQKTTKKKSETLEQGSFL
jgi:hypothetical protein